MGWSKAAAEWIYLLELITIAHQLSKPERELRKNEVELSKQSSLKQ